MVDNDAVGKDRGANYWRMANFPPVKKGVAVMYADDVSAIPSGGCNYYNGTTVQHYADNNHRQTYAQTGGKWYLISSDYSQYGYNMPSVCFDVSNLHTNAAFEPIFDAIAVFAAIFIFLFAFKLIRPIFGGHYGV